MTGYHLVSSNMSGKSPINEMPWMGKSMKIIDGGYSSAMFYQQKETQLGFLIGVIDKACENRVTFTQEDGLKMLTRVTLKPFKNFY